MRRKTSGERTETTAFFIFSAKKIIAGLPGDDRFVNPLRMEAMP